MDMCVLLCSVGLVDKCYGLSDASASLLVTSPVQSVGFFRKYNNVSLRTSGKTSA